MPEDELKQMPSIMASQKDAQGVRMVKRGPESADGAHKRRHFVYHRGSMYRTLRAGDLLEVAPLDGRVPAVGDVVVFRSPERGAYVVHRVSAILPGAIQTRADRNRSPDPWYVQPKQIVGRVVGIVRAGKRRPVWGGALGQATALLNFWLVRFLKKTCRLKSVVFRVLSVWGALPRAFSFLCPPRVVVLRTQDRLSAKLVLGRWLAGTYDPSCSRWHIRMPFRLLIDAPRLPDPAGCFKKDRGEP